MYEDVKLKKSFSVDVEQNKKTMKSPRNKTKVVTKLDSQDENDRKIIDER